MSIKTAFETLLSVVFSAPCPTCGQGGRGGRLCEVCFSEIIRTVTFDTCSVCDEPFHRGVPGVRPATRCIACRDGRSFSFVRSLGLFEGRLRDAILHVKYRGRRALGYDLGRRAAEELREALGPVDRVVPIPLGPARQKERGYNQSEILGEGVAKALGVRMETGLLRRLRDTTPQTSLSRAERRRNLSSVFVGKLSTADLRILLVDDVVTTGATVEEGARALLDAGASEVRVLALARSRLGASG